MLFVDTFMYYFNKDYYDFDDTSLGYTDFHPQVQIVLAINGLFFKNKTSWYRFLYPFFVTSLSAVAVVMELMALCHALATGDLALGTACFSYAVVVCVVPFVYVCMATRSDTIYNMVANMESDFQFICDLGEPWRSKFLKGQRIIWMCGFAWMSFILFVFIGIVSLSLVSLFIHCLVAPDENRPLIYPLWLPYDDPFRTPNYEIFLTIMYLVMANYILTFVSYVYFAFHLLLHSYYLLDLTISALEVLFDGVDERVAFLPPHHQMYRDAMKVFVGKFRIISKWHNGAFMYIKDALHAFGLVISYQVSLSSVIIVLMSFYLSVTLEEGSLDVYMTLISVAAVIQLWIPCYLGSLLESKGYDVADACFYSGWSSSRLGSMVRLQLVLVTARAQQPITIRVAPLPVLNLETFSSTLEEGSLDVYMTLISVAAVIQLWIPCYLGSLLESKGYDVADACFYSGWSSSRLGSMVRLQLVLVTARAQQPITIRVAPLPVLNLETFSSILSTAYSYFNMMRQSGAEK